MITTTKTATMTVPEILLMLRAPGAGWLATLLAGLDEAQRDPDFDPRQRLALAQLASEQGLACAIVEAAQHRAAIFETELAQVIAPRHAQRQADVA